jgi:hypothetical protein
MAPTKAQSIYGLPKKGLVIKLASSHGLSNLEWICLNQLWYIFLSTAIIPTCYSWWMSMYSMSIPCQCIALHHRGKYWQTRKIRSNVWVSTFPCHQSHVDTSIGCSHSNPKKNTHISLSHPVTWILQPASTNARARLCRRFWRCWLEEASIWRGSAESKRSCFFVISCKYCFH